MKLQVPSKARGKGQPKWIPPEKIMRQYRKNMKDPRKVNWTKFRIVVPTEDDKRQLQACFEYIHDNQIMDCKEDFIVLNQIAHCYLDQERETGTVSMIVVDADAFKEMSQKTCPHGETWNDHGIEICKWCDKHLRVTSFRD
jgi:hypothetical protein